MHLMQRPIRVPDPPRSIQVALFTAIALAGCRDTAMVVAPDDPLPVTARVIEGGRPSHAAIVLDDAVMRILPALPPDLPGATFRRELHELRADLWNGRRADDARTGMLNLLEALSTQAEEEFQPDLSALYLSLQAALTTE